MKVLRYAKMTCKWVSPSIWALLGNMEGVRLPGRFERKEKLLSGFLS